MRLIFLGPPGVGKGTQAKLLASARGLTHVATGDMLRDAVRHSTTMGVKAKAFMDKGQLVPDDMVIGMIEDLFIRDGIDRGFILDGFPRTVTQAESLSRLLVTLELQAQAVFYFDAPEDSIVERMSGRRTCPRCGALYHVTFVPPKVAETCDRCGSALSQRTDDTPAAIRQQLLQYHSQTSGLILYYGQASRLHRIDASRSPQEVFDAVQRICSGIKE